MVDLSVARIFYQAVSFSICIRMFSALAVAWALLHVAVVLACHLVVFHPLGFQGLVVRPSAVVLGS